MSSVSQHIRWLPRISYELFSQVWYQRLEQRFWFWRSYCLLLSSQKWLAGILRIGHGNAHKDGNACHSPCPGSLVLPVAGTVPLCVAAGILRVPVKLFCILRAWHCLLGETKTCLSFRSQPTGKQGQPDCFGTDGCLPCSGISLAKRSLTIHKYQMQL